MTNFVQPIYFSKRIVTTDLPAFVMGILNATPDSLIGTFEKSLGCNMDGFFDSWINGNVVIKRVS